MLSFITGLPGAGKTLHAIWRVERFRKAETAAARKIDPSAPERPVYYFGISGLTLDWIEFADVSTWPDLPAGSIIVIDEAQRELPCMSASAKRPRHYTEIDTHRHRGFDIILITQDAMLVDQRFRSMAERHIHVSRSYGMPSATIYDWKGVQRTTGVAKLNDKDGTLTQWKYPRELFEVYKSAEVHTHRPRLPWKKLAQIAATILAAVGLISYAVASFTAKGETAAGVVVEGTDVQGLSGAVGASGGDRGRFVDVWADPSLFEPRVDGLPVSAAAYGEHGAIVDAPRIDGCSLMEFDDGRYHCECNDQRGGHIDVTPPNCRAFVRARGWFDPTARQ